MDDSRTLFVGNLGPDITEALLRELFLQAGPIEKVRLARVNGVPKPFAHIVYHHECSVNYATDIFKGTKLHKRELTLQQHSNAPRDSGFVLCICNKFLQHCDYCLMDIRGSIHMDSDEQLSQMADMAGNEHQNWSSENMGNDATPGKLFVGGLSWQTTTDKLKDYFSIFGEVDEAVIMMDPVTQRSRGFGFVTFISPDAVEKVLKVPIHTLDGKKIDPKCATPKVRGKGGNRTKKIFVGGISQDTTAEEVRGYFSQFGRVQECVMLIDQQTKRHRGFGFVIFDCEEIVDQVCEIHFHTIKNKKVECKKAQTKEAIQSDLQKNTPGGNAALPTPQPSMGSPQMAAMQAQAYLQAALAAITAQAQAAAMSGNGKLFGAHPGLGSMRYAPYPMPGMGGVQQAGTAMGSGSQSVGGSGTSQGRTGGMGGRGGMGVRQMQGGGGGSPNSQRGMGGGDSYGGLGDMRRPGGNIGGSRMGAPMNNPFQGNSFNFPGMDMESMFGMGSM